MLENIQNLKKFLGKYLTWRSPIPQNMDFPKYAYAMFNGDLIWIGTKSMAGIQYYDPKGLHVDIPITSSDRDLGRSLVACLKRSRVKARYSKSEKAYITTFNEAEYSKYEAFYENLVNKLLLKYHYSNRNDLFKNMNLCDIALYENKITINPLHHVSLERWGHQEAVSDDSEVSIVIDAISINEDSDPDEIGKALRIGFKRCTGNKL